METDSDRTVILGGTFNPIHNGHRALLHKAFQTASKDGDGHVIVGVTADELASETRDDPEQVKYLDTAEKRREDVIDELEGLSKAYTATYEVFVLEQASGPTEQRDGLDALVISPEAKAQRRARELNQSRLEEGLAPLEIHTAPFVTAEDGSRISSTRIRNGELDQDGQLIQNDE